MPGPVIEEQSPAATLRTWRDRVVEGFRAFSTRVFIHAAAFISSFALARASGLFDLPGYPGPGRVAATLAAYIGIICIVGRGSPRSTSWLFPAGAGGIQAFILAALGIPFSAAIFWGGAQSFVSRLFFRRPAPSELPVLLFLLPLSIIFFPSVSPLPLVISFATLAAFSGIIVWRLRSRTRVAVQGSDSTPGHTAGHETTTARAEAVTRYRQSVREIRAKQPQLPVPIRPALSAILTSAENILVCMEEDPRDLETGQRFLKRYLTATHTVVDKHLRLSREEITPEIAAALTESTEMLEKLQSAFAKEYAYLLKNDIDDFSADLKVLDTLLKMDGR